MGTFSKVYIKLENIEVILHELQEYFLIGKIETLDDSKWWLYSENGNETIILSNNYNHNWCEIEFEFKYSIYIYDEFLRRFSKKFNAIILLGYYQSTIGNGRIAKFNNGQLELSIVQQYSIYNGIEKIYLNDNFGVSKTIKKEFKIPKLGEDFNNIDYELINSFFAKNGLLPDNFKNYEEWSYLHIEKINE
ncbi:hypothetical protein [Chryseobacterium lathyri]|uniref:Uncharacterized protein n=1 Tax=Chryseobacterium lathyri TaxID=395933 RepID=A0ABT9SM92_9FLAO|nr:hypothetical protein [Chryseobacterium lathyri]MDP9960388.1 hypothetical protein [Chryseobacterium lathyri]